jgi:hypothetical protein
MNGNGILLTFVQRIEVHFYLEDASRGDSLLAACWRLSGPANACIIVCSAPTGPGRDMKIAVALD